MTSLLLCWYIFRSMITLLKDVVNYRCVEKIFIHSRKIYFKSPLISQFTHSLTHVFSIQLVDSKPSNVSVAFTASSESSDPGHHLPKRNGIAPQPADLLPPARSRTGAVSAKSSLHYLRENHRCESGYCEAIMGMKLTHSLVSVSAAPPSLSVWLFVTPHTPACFIVVCFIVVCVGLSARICLVSYEVIEIEVMLAYPAR